MIQCSQTLIKKWGSIRNELEKPAKDCIMKGGGGQGELGGLYTKEDKKSLEGLPWWSSG